MNVSNLLFLMMLASSVALADAATNVEPLDSTPHEQAMQYLKECGKLLQPDAYVALNPEEPNPFMAAMDQTMRKEVIGQDEAVENLSAAHEMVLSGMQDPERPLGSFLFIGPTGVGKTELSKAYVTALGGNSDEDLIRIDLGTFAGHPEKISQLLGASAGYIGYGDPPVFDPTNLEKRKVKVVTPNGRILYVNVILLDEIEKAPHEVFLTILSLLDHGRVQLGNGTWVNLRNSIVIATSNLGAREVNELLQKKRDELAKSSVGDLLTDEEADTTGRKNPELKQQVKGVYQQAIAKKFDPEFPPRWDRIIEFYHLSQPEFEKILTKLTAKLQKRIFNNADVKVNIELTESAREQLIRVGTNYTDGARPLRNTLERSISRPLGRLANLKQIKEGDVVRADYTSTGWHWNIVGPGLTRPEMLKTADAEYPGYKMLDVKFEPTAMADNQTPYDKMDIISALNLEYRNATAKSSGAPSVLRNLWMESKKQSGLAPKMANITVPEGNSSKVVKSPVQYIMIGDAIVRIEQRGDKYLAEQRSIVELFPEEQIKRWTVEEVREMFPKPAAAEPPKTNPQKAPDQPKAREPMPL